MIGSAIQVPGVCSEAMVAYYSKKKGRKAEFLKTQFRFNLGGRVMDPQLPRLRCLGAAITSKWALTNHGRFPLGYRRNLGGLRAEFRRNAAKPEILLYFGHWPE